jgi:hypothetical protein
MVGKLLCRIGFHHWEKFQNDAGEFYLECSRCGKYSEPPMGKGWVAGTPG